MCRLPILEVSSSMAMQSGIATSKVLILVGAGLTGTIVLRSGRLSDIILQLHELTKGVNEPESSPGYDGAFLAAQIRQLAQEIREMTTTNPVTIYTGSSSSSGSYSSYLMPAAALGAVGYCYMWWKGWSLSDVMFVTKHNMANAVATVSKQLEHVSESLASTRKHLAKRLETLDWKMDEQKELSDIIASDVGEVRSNLNQIGFDIETIHQMVSGLEGQIELLESKQDVTNAGLWYLCQAAGGIKDGTNSKPFLDVGAKIKEHSSIAYNDKLPKGLSLFAESSDELSTQKVITGAKKSIHPDNPVKAFSTVRTRIHRSYPVSLSATLDILG